MSRLRVHNQFTSSTKLHFTHGFLFQCWLARPRFWVTRTGSIASCSCWVGAHCSRTPGGTVTHTRCTWCRHSPQLCGCRSRSPSLLILLRTRTAVRSYLLKRVSDNETFRTFGFFGVGGHNERWNLLYRLGVRSVGSELVAERWFLVRNEKYSQYCNTL